MLVAVTVIAVAIAAAVIVAAVLAAGRQAQASDAQLREQLAALASGAQLQQQSQQQPSWKSRRAEEISCPGALTSGFCAPSRRGPRLEESAILPLSFPEEW